MREWGIGFGSVLVVYGYVVKKEVPENILGRVYGIGPSDVFLGIGILFLLLMGLAAVNRRLW